MSGDNVLHKRAELNNSFLGPTATNAKNAGGACKPQMRRHIPYRNRINTIAVCGISAIIVIAIFPIAGYFASGPDSRSAPESVSIIAGVPLIHQHKDTAMVCIPCGASPPIHAWNDAKGPDGIYGTPDDCPHCSVYCAPASIAMVSSYRGRLAQFTQQDDIYDNGKMQPPEIMGNGIIETHGVGMLDSPPSVPANLEVQKAFQWSVGTPIIQYDSSGGLSTQLTAIIARKHISSGTPIIWCDHNGFPANQSSSYPPSRTDQGHVKVIIGYDDGGTVDDTSDDRYLINDPWPEYVDRSILPAGASLGPGGTFNPYWIPDSKVFDVNDIYLVDTFGSVPEKPVYALIVIGIPISAAAVIATFMSTRKKSAI